MSTDTTAMQELIIWLEQNVGSAESKYSRGALRISIRKATELLSKEKEQIIEAYNQGYRDSELHPETAQSTQDISIFSDAEDYFKEKYQTK